MATNSGPGISVVTDNWLLQNAAELVAGNTDPLSVAAIPKVHANELTSTETRLGTVQFRCLTSLLEQITLADSLFVLEGWTDTWTGRLAELDALFGTVVRPLGSRDAVTMELRNEYQSMLCSHEPIRKAYNAAEEALRRNVPLPGGQVTNGTAVYLALADLKNCAYAPHPARAAFLRQTLYSSTAWPPRAATKVLERLSKARVKLLRMLRGDAEISSLEYSISPIALRCFAESSASSRPISIAAQLRSDDRVRELRACLHECAQALASDPPRAAVLMESLEAAIADAEKRLRIEALGPTDGPSHITVFKLPLPVPDVLRRVRTPRTHSAVMQDFIQSGTRQVREIVAEGLGIRNRVVLDTLLATM